MLFMSAPHEEGVEPELEGEMLRLIRVVEDMVAFDDDEAEQHQRSTAGDQSAPAGAVGSSGGAVPGHAGEAHAAPGPSSADDENVDVHGERRAHTRTAHRWH